MNFAARLGRRRVETPEQMRQRMIAETSVFISECLRRPELAVRIPIVRAGAARFPRSLSEAFWLPVLAE